MMPIGRASGIQTIQSRVDRDAILYGLCGWPDAGLSRPHIRGRSGIRRALYASGLLKPAAIQVT